MHIKSSAFGRSKKAHLGLGVGRIELKAQVGHEAKKLKLVLDEVQHGNLGFWAQLIWAMQNNKAPKSLVEKINNLVNKTADDSEYLSFIDGPTQEA